MVVARRLLGTTVDAEDAAQETFVRVWRSLKTWRREAPLRAWILQIAVNVSRTAGAQRRPTPSIADLPEPVDPRPRADRALAADEAGRAVRDAVATLPPRQREVVLLKVFTEMTHDDVACALGLTTGAVKAHLHQAVANLRRRLAGGEGAEG